VIEIRKVVLLGVASDEQRHLNLLQPRQQSMMPKIGTLGSRWSIAGRPRTWITETHGDQSNQVGIVELFPVNTQPSP